MMRGSEKIFSFVLIVLVGFPLAFVLSFPKGGGALLIWYVVLGIWVLAATAGAKRQVRTTAILIYLAPPFYLFALPFVLSLPKNIALKQMEANSITPTVPVVGPIRGDTIVVRGDKYSCDKICIELLTAAGAASVTMEKAIASRYDHTEADKFDVGVARTYRINKAELCEPITLQLSAFAARGLQKRFKYAGVCPVLTSSAGADNSDWIIFMGDTAHGIAPSRFGLQPTIGIVEREVSESQPMAYKMDGYVWSARSNKYFKVGKDDFKALGKMIGVAFDDTVLLGPLFSPKEQDARLQYFTRLAESGDLELWRAFISELAAMPQLTAESFELIERNYNRYGGSGLLSLSHLMARRTDDFKPALPMVMDIISKGEPGWGHLYGGLRWYDLADLAPYERQLGQVKDRRIALYHRSKEHPATTLCRKGANANDSERQELLENLTTIRRWDPAGRRAQLLAVARLTSPVQALQILDRGEFRENLWMTRRCLQKLEEHYGHADIPARFCHIEGCSRAWNLGKPPASMSR